MAVHLRTNVRNADEYENLMTRLLREWRNPQESQSEEPIIIEERPSNYDRVNHLYVVWSEWGDLTPLERSKLVLQAYARLRGQDLANDVTLAMGLTPNEAEVMGISLS
jgi:hypothetical protein